MTVHDAIRLDQALAARHRAQAHLRRCVVVRVKVTGLRSSCEERSSPITAIACWQHAQVVDSGST